MGLVSTGRDLSSTAFWSACNLGNLGGGAAGTVPHPTRRGPGGRPERVPGAVPDLAAPAIAIPDSVTDLVLLGDTTSDPFTTRLALARATARYARPGRTVRVAWAPQGEDFDDPLRAAKGDEAARAALERIAAIIAAAAPLAPEAGAKKNPRRRAMAPIAAMALRSRERLEIPKPKTASRLMARARSALASKSSTGSMRW
jgi:hypothetical protein